MFTKWFSYVAPWIKNEKNIKLIMLPLGAVFLIIAIALFFIFKWIPKEPEKNSKIYSEDDGKDKSLLAGEKLYAMNASYE